MARESWRTPFKDVFITLNRGQPMGVNVSFLTFSIYLYHLLTEEFGEDSFFQVGDDIVVRDGYKALDLFSRLGIPVSEDKSLIGPFVEFCGTIITKDGDLQSWKTREHRYKTLIASFGKSALALVPKHKRYIYDVMKLPFPVGVGLNPKVVACLPPSVVLQLYGSQPSLQIPIRIMPPKEGQRYAELFISAIDQIGSKFSMMPAFARDQLASFVADSLSPGPEVWNCADRIYNFLAESANVLFQEGYSIDDVKHHLTIVGNLMHFPEFTLPLSVITDSYNPLRNVATHAAWKKVSSYITPTGHKHMTKSNPKAVATHQTSSSAHLKVDASGKKVAQGFNTKSGTRAGQNQTCDPLTCQFEYMTCLSNPANSVFHPGLCAGVKAGCMAGC
jgi:hypothetical protein